MDYNKLSSARLLNRIFFHNRVRTMLSPSVLVLGVLSVGVPFALEVVPDYVQQHKACRQQDYQSILSAGFYYHRLTRLNRQAERNRYTRLVTISEGSEGRDVLHQHCIARELHSRLALVLLKAHPGAIVFDYRYTTDNCPTDSPSSRHLQAALDAAVSDRIDVVLGLADLTQRELDSAEIGNSVARRLDPSEAILDPQQWHPVALGEQYVHYGLVRLQCEVELLPLSWSTYTRSDLKKSERLPTLARATAEAFDPGVLSQGDVQKADADQIELVVPFLTQKEIMQVSATRLLCGTDSGPGAWKNCAGENTSPALLHELSSHIVIVCSFGSDDRHATPIGGSVPGGVLQANYIEALLGGTYYERANWLIGLPISFGWFVALHRIWKRHEFSPVRALVMAVSLSVLIVVGAYVVFARLFNAWLILWPPGAIAIVGKCMELLLTRRKERHGAQKIATS